MTIEKFANLAETVLAVNYTGGGGTITVSDPSLFPTAGLFRIRLQNTARTLLIVTAVAGAVFSVTVEFNDGPASAGAGVILIATKGSSERFLQSPESGEIRAPSGVLGADYYGPLWKLFDFDPTGWTWDNQGGATIAKSFGVSYLTGPDSAGENNRMLWVAAPSTPYKFKTLMIPNPLWAAAGQAWMGLALRDAGGKIISAVLRGNAGGSSADLHVRKLNNTTSFNSDAFVSPSVIVPGPGIFIRIGDSGVTVTFEFSFDNINWLVGLSEARGTFFTTAPDAYGLLIRNATGSGLAVGASYLGLEQE